MEITFIDELPIGNSRIPIIISGSHSLVFPNKQFLILMNADECINIYELRYQYKCSPFQQAELIGGLLAVGHQEHFYLFDLIKNSNILVSMMSGYFGHFYKDNALLFVADATQIHCLGNDGSALWISASLGVDGVIIHDFDDSKIYGTGEWDPPGGWREFVLDKITGLQVG